MKWRQFVKRVYDTQPRNDSQWISAPEFYPPAEPGDFIKIKSALGSSLPTSLNELLLESNGIFEKYGIEGQMTGNMWFIWPTERIIKENVFLRTDKKMCMFHQTAQKLLFFADAGVDGILFAYRILQGGIDDPEIYVWYPYENDFKPIAPSLRVFIEQWLSGRLKI